MEEVKVSELPVASTVNDDDIVMIVQNGFNKQITKEDLFNDTEENIEDVETNLQEQITNLQNQVNDKNIITAGLSSNVTISTGGANNINLNTTIASVGSKLTLSNGKIVIGAGVNHVLIGGQGKMYVATGNGDAKNFIIFKNDTAVITNLNTLVRQYALNVTRGIGAFLLSVSQGDTISYQVYAGVGDVVSEAGNYITVEVID